MRMGSLCQGDSMRRARDVCEGICNRIILHISYYSKYGFCFFGDDRTSPTDEFKKAKRVQRWSRQIMGGAFIICNTITL